MKHFKSSFHSTTIEGPPFKQLNAFLKKSAPGSIFILCDENTLLHCAPPLMRHCPSLKEAHIIEIESGESSKSLEISSMIWETLAENHADQNSLLLNLGGGVVTDLGAFVASVYKRGIPFIHVPTTLLAMADASIGGKTGLDFHGIKNLIGTFAHPQAVFVNPGFLETLPHRQYKNGLVEIVKIALVCDAGLWNALKKKRSNELLITNSILLKSKIVEKDPRDKGLRKILNYGHTIGHAIEALSLGTKDELLHGEAVLYGMLVESVLALHKKLITKKQFQEIFEVLRSRFEIKIPAPISHDAIFDLLLNDKKTRGQKLRFSLPGGIGKCKTDVVCTVLQIEKALQHTSSLLHA